MVLFRSLPDSGGAPENRALYDEDPFVRLDVEGATPSDFTSGLSSGKGGGKRHLIVSQYWSDVAFDAFLEVVMGARESGVEFRELKSGDRIVKLLGEKSVAGERAGVLVLYGKTRNELELTLTAKAPTFANRETVDAAIDPQVAIAAGLSDS